MKNVELKFDTTKIAKALLPVIKERLEKLAKSNFQQKTKHLTSEIEKENGRIDISITPNNGDYKIRYDATNFSSELEAKLTKALSE